MEIYSLRFSVSDAMQCAWFVFEHSVFSVSISSCCSFTYHRRYHFVMSSSSVPSRFPGSLVHALMSPLALADTLWCFVSSLPSMIGLTSKECFSRKGWCFSFTSWPHISSHWRGFGNNSPLACWPDRTFECGLLSWSNTVSSMTSKDNRSFCCYVVMPWSVLMCFSRLSATLSVRFSGVWISFLLAASATHARYQWSRFCFPFGCGRAEQLRSVSDLVGVVCI